MNYSLSVPTYIIINEEKNPNNKENVLKEFSGHDEFVITVVNTFENEGTWNTVARILKGLPEEKPEFILICEDSHQFTPAYSSAYLVDNIRAAQRMEADILIGGPGSFDNAVRVAEHLYWVEDFNGFQFIIFFNKFFEPVLNSAFRDCDDMDVKLSRPTGRKMFIHPYISTQREAEYPEDISSGTPGMINRLFENSAARVDSINKIANYYNSIPIANEELNADDYDDVKIPTYVINLPERTERLEHIMKEFEGRDEFDITIVPACRHDIGAIGLWLSIRKILTMALENDDDDVIIICEDDHQFTEAYSKETLIRNIVEAHLQGAALLAGGIGHFTQIIPLTRERFWIDSFWSTQFLVLFKKSFSHILSREFDDTVTADDFLSEIIDEKMVIFPFISIQKDFGYSDISKRNEVRETPDIFERCAGRLRRAIHIHEKYGFTSVK